MLKKDPLFKGSDNIDQLVRIAKVLGTDDLWAYLDKIQIELPQDYDNILGSYPKRPWSKFVSGENQHLVSNEAFDVLDGLLIYDRERRLTASECMEMPYFDEVRRQDGLRKAQKVLERTGGEVIQEVTPTPGDDEKAGARL